MSFGDKLRSLCSEIIDGYRRLPSPESLSARFDAYVAKMREEAAANRANWTATPQNVTCLAIATIAIVNFLAFVVISMVIGGDAFNGHIEDGHYFLSDHGKMHQVSKGVFTYSLWHVRSLFITHPLAILMGVLLNRDEPKRSTSK